MALLGASQSAQAGLSVTLSQTGFGSLVIPDWIDDDGNPGYTSGDAGYTGANQLDTNKFKGSIAFNDDFGTFTGNTNTAIPVGVSLTVNSNSVGSTIPTIGGVVRDVTAVARNAAAGTQTLNLSVSSDGFLNPSASSVVLTSSLSSDLLSAGNLSTNTQAGIQFVSTLISGAATTSVPSISLSSPGSVSSSVTAANPSPPYTLTNQLSLTLGGDGFANATATTQAILPEPSTIAMALMALPLLGIGYRMRRRAQTV